MANMKYQKKRIDGSDVIMHEPQHLDGTEYVNTGTSNPLPTKDESVEARLQAIEQTQSQILDKLNDTIDTRLTGSNVAKGIPVQVEKDFIEVSVTGNDVEPGKDQIFDVYSKPGEIWTLKRFGYYAYRNTESVGDHRIWLYHGESQSDSNFIMSIEGKSNQFMRGAIPGRRQSTYTGEILPSDIYELIETVRDT